MYKLPFNPPKSKELYEGSVKNDRQQKPAPALFEQARVFALYGSYTSP